MTTTGIRTPLMETDCNAEAGLSTSFTLKKEDIILSKEENEFKCESTQKDATYFRNLLQETRIELLKKCEIWTNLPKEDLDEDIKGEIRAAVGKAHLVIKERGDQFEGLISSHENGSTEKKILISDLQGFWDMIYFQVVDVNEMFSLLNKKRENNWVLEEKENEPKIPKKLKKKVKKGAISTKSKKASNVEARKRLAAAKAALSNRENDKTTFDAVFFKVESPLKLKTDSKIYTQSPLVSSHKKPVTPCPKNFLHGRIIRSNLKQTSDPKTDSCVGSVDIAKTVLSFSDENASEDPLADQIAVTGGSGDVVFTESSNSTSFQMTSATCGDIKMKSIATETDLPDNLEASERITRALQVVEEQLKIVINNQQTISPTNNIHPESEERIKHLKAENEHLKKQLKATAGSDPYESYYRKSQLQILKLEAKLKFQDMLTDKIPSVREKLQQVYKKLHQQQTENEQKQSDLSHLEEELNTRLQSENKELMKLREACRSYQADLESAHLVLDQNQEMRETLSVTNESLDEKNRELQELYQNYQILESEAENKFHELNDEKVKLSEKLEDLENIRNIIEFENNELTVSNQLKDSEIGKLKEIVEEAEKQMTIKEEEKDHLNLKIIESEVKFSNLNKTFHDSKRQIKVLKTDCNQLTKKNKNLERQHNEEITKNVSVLESIFSLLQQFQTEIESTEKEQCRRSLDFLNTKTTSLEDLEDKSNGDNPISSKQDLHDEDLIKKTDKVLEFLTYLLAKNKKVQAKYYEDQLRLTCDYRAMSKKLVDYQRRSSDDKANASHKLAANEKMIEMLTKERDEYAEKYKQSESFNLRFNKT